MAQLTKKRQKGAGYIEVLVSSLILALSLLAALSLYGFSMGMIDKSGDEGVAYNIARKALENVRQNGFDPIDSSKVHLLPDGTTTTYYTSLGISQGATSNSDTRFRCDVKVLTDKLIKSTSLPAPDGLRAVTITVSYVKSGEVIEKTGTFLVRSGL